MRVHSGQCEEMKQDLRRHRDPIFKIHPGLFGNPELIGENRDRRFRMTELIGPNLAKSCGQFHPKLLGLGHQGSLEGPCRTKKRGLVKPGEPEVKNHARNQGRDRFQSGGGIGENRAIKSLPDSIVASHLIKFNLSGEIMMVLSLFFALSDLDVAFDWSRSRDFSDLSQSGDALMICLE